MFDAKESVPCFVAIAGCSGSGKTTVAARVCELLGPDSALLLATDLYYRDLSHLSPPERSRINFDDPNCLEHELLTRDIDSLSRGHAITAPRYDFCTHMRSGYSAPQRATPIVVIEGIYALYWPDIRSRCTVKVFVDTPLEKCFERRLTRDQNERGRSAEMVAEQWESTVKPMFLREALPTKSFASLCIDGCVSVQANAQKVLAALKIANA